MKKTLWMKAFGLVLLPTWLLSLSLAVSAHSAQDLIYITSLPNKIVVLDGGRDEIAREISLRGTPYYITSTRDGRRIFAITGKREFIDIIDAEEGKVIDSINFSQEKVKVRFFGLAVSPEGNRIYAHIMTAREGLDELVADPPYVAVVDLQSKKITDKVVVPFGVGALLPLTDGKKVYAFGRDLYVIDPAQRKIVETIGLANPHQGGEGSLDALPFWTHYTKDGLFAIPFVTQDPITSSPQIGLLLLDTVSGKTERVELGPPVPIFSAVVSPDRQTAYGVFTQITTVDLKEKRIAKTSPLPASFYTVDVSSNGKKLYISGAAPQVLVVDAVSLQTLKSIDLPGNTFDLRVIPKE